MSLSLSLYPRRAQNKSQSLRHPPVNYIMPLQPPLTSVARLQAQLFTPLLVALCYLLSLLHDGMHGMSKEVHQVIPKIGVLVNLATL
jgi:hypothetical protein